jgi:rod shape determining protein RodA
MSAAMTPIRDVDDAPPGGARSGARPPGMALPFDVVLLIGVPGLAACSLITIRASTEDDIPGDPLYFLKRQAAFFAVGLFVALVLSRVDYSRLRELKYGVYGFLLLSIFAVMALGSVARGSQRSIALGPFQFQASELGKVLLVVALSAFVVDRSRRLHERDTTARVMLLALVPAALVMVQPDLGSSLVYVAIVLAVLFFAGTSWRHFVALLALGAVAISVTLVAAPAAGVTVLHDYQKERLTSFLHPSGNPGDEGYQQNQSRIAIGSGEKTGRGDRATQTKFNFLPEHHTDFIFAVVGERWGFVGGALVLSLYALLIWRGLRILTMAKNLFGALIAGGIVAMLLFQVFVNVGMNVGIMPITGIPLPLMSYGGSSVVSTLIAVGLLQSIYVQGRAAASLKGRVLGL